MCLVRLVAFLKLNKVTQVAFAEYHSKRNFVERVHAQENQALYKHGSFKSHAVHEHATAGSKMHRENMEHMCEEVRKCLEQASFSGKPLQCYRGIKTKDFIFDDEKNLKMFLALSEDGKEDFPTATYLPQHNHLFQTLVHTWNLDTDFHGSYHNDYWLLRNEVEGIHTAWLDKYTSVIYSADETSTIERFERQPLPDYIRWVNTSELHYLSLENQLKINTGVWDEISGLFLPTKILDLCV